MNKKKSGIIIIIAIYLIILVAEFFFLRFEYKKHALDCPEIHTAVWSAQGGTADGRIALNRDFSSISQVFVNPHNTPENIILFFYHCDTAKSGILSMKLKDDAGTVLKENTVDLAWYNEDVLCLILIPDEVPMEKGKQYTVDVSVTDIGDDSIEVGATLNPSKPAVFRNFANHTALFMGMEYTYTDLSDATHAAFLYGILLLPFDIVMLLVMFGIYFGKWNLFRWLCLGVFVAVGIICLYLRYHESRQWYNRYEFVVHALGELDGHQYLNFSDAFHVSLEGGHKVFEADFMMTSDRDIVLKHDWESSHGLPQFENGYIPTHDEFMNARIWDKYETTDLHDLFDLMIENPDIYIVTDSKEDGYKETVEQFTRAAEILSEYPALKRRHIKEHLIVQLYNEDMYTAVESTFDAKHYLFTIYKQGGTDSLDRVLYFCKKNKIEVLTMPYNWWDEEVNEKIHSYGMKTYLHTLNDAAEIADYTQKGVDGFYTDVTDLNELEKEIQSFMNTGNLESVQ
ncbi:MAG: hypothetical protein IIZ41_06755 [Lachnospiraceae bacterium]|nr:hypothetical protein [Lachnospiraceae bacterium]